MIHDRARFVPLERNVSPGMGQAVAERTVFRKKPDGQWERWADVADRVSLGNTLLVPGGESDRETLRLHMAKGTILSSGRHLQHGDATQPQSTQERMTNCSSSATSFVEFYLLLNGSGVGRAYDDDLMVVDWDNAPAVRCVLSESHPDYDYSAHESVRDAKHRYGTGKDVKWFEVPDSREGWAKAIELWELAAFEKVHRDKMLVLDFSAVRPKGSPIGGMQGRPASGPVPLMNAINKAASVRGAGLEPWLQAMYIDHFLAECVLVGGARRAARMSTKYWKDRSVLRFIEIKRPIEFHGLGADAVAELRKASAFGGFLWSSNNSVGVDDEFWNLVRLRPSEPGYDSDDAIHARTVFERVTACAYGDGTGEPGLINMHKLSVDRSGLKDLTSKPFIGSSKYQIEEDTEILYKKLAKRVLKKKHPYNINPCAEITFLLLGAFCVIGDVVPYHADTLDECEDAFRAMSRALIRVNTMDSIYRAEVQRTNRIGVGITGIHEFAWKFFGYGFRDLIDENKSMDFWQALARFSRATVDEADDYSRKLGLPSPHTVTTIKPSGTTSKLFGLTEGWHLPAMPWYMRWVQFRSDSPLIDTYKAMGYPTRTLRSYENTVIVGFPTQPTIGEIMPADKIVTAGEATMEEQFEWLRLGEKYWLEGDGAHPDRANQISFTMKYDPKKLDFDSFRDQILKYQPTVKCCSVMPQEDCVSYEYQPEEPLTKAKYEEAVAKIKTEFGSASEDIGREHVDCASGACPIDYTDGEKQA